MQCQALGRYFLALNGYGLSSFRRLTQLSHELSEIRCSNLFHPIPSPTTLLIQPPPPIRRPHPSLNILLLSLFYFLIPPTIQTSIKDIIFIVYRIRSTIWALTYIHLREYNMCVKGFQVSILLLSFFGRNYLFHIIFSHHLINCIKQ